MTITLDLGAVLVAAACLPALSMLLLLGTWRAVGRPAYLAAWSGFCGLAAAAAQREAAALVAGRADVERLLAGVPAVIFLRDGDPDGTSRLLYRGGDLEAVTGWPAAMVEGMDDLASLRDDPEGHFDTVPTRLLRHGAVVVDWRIRQPEGPSRWMRTRSRMLSLRPDGGGEIVGYILDVSAEYAAAAAAEAARGREAAALQAGRAEVERLLTNVPAMIFLRNVAADGTSRPLYRAGDTVVVTGWPKAAMASDDFYEANTDKRLAGHAAWCRAVLRDGTASIDWRLRRPDGGWTWLRTHGRRLTLGPDGGGEIAGYQVNIDRERQAQAGEAAARDELDRTLAAAPLAVFRHRVTPDGRFSLSYLSRGIETLAGFPWAQVSTHSRLLDVLETEGFGEIETINLQLRAEGSARVDHRLRHADGRWLEVRTTFTVLATDPDGSLEVVGFVVDVTAERQALARIAGAARLASLGEMGAGLAHELKQPLAIMSMAAENALGALRRGRAEAAIPRLERIVDQAQRAAGIIENLRRFARGGDPGAPPAPMRLDRAVANALALVGGPLAEAEIEVAVALGTPPPVALGQQVSMEQVLVNLLLNAADALRSRPPGTVRRIRIAAEAADGPAGHMVGLTIADTGGGIPRAILPRLFEPFVSTKDAEHGTGLGLSICHGLVMSMGGAIAARNEADGALFTILLPAAMAELPVAV